MEKNYYFFGLYTSFWNITIIATQLIYAGRRQFKIQFICRFVVVVLAAENSRDAMPNKIESTCALMNVSLSLCAIHRPMQSISYCLSYALKPTETVVLIENFFFFLLHSVFYFDRWRLDLTFSTPWKVQTQSLFSLKPSPNHLLLFFCWWCWCGCCCSASFQQ